MCGIIEDQINELLAKFKEIVRKYNLTYEQAIQLASSLRFNLTLSQISGTLKDNFGIEDCKHDCEKCPQLFNCESEYINIFSPGYGDRLVNEFIKLKNLVLKRERELKNCCKLCRKNNDLCNECPIKKELDSLSDIMG